MHRLARAVGALTLIGVVALLTAACGDDDGGGTDTGGGGGGESSGASGKIALLLPETKTARYETHDRPLFEARVDEICPDCEVLYSNANQDAARQQSQAEAAITNGAEVLVLDPVDSASAAAIAARAKQSDIPVVAYDRLILNSEDVDAYLSYDNEKVGSLQGNALVEALEAANKDSGTVVMINGAPTDNNAKLFKAGAHSVLDDSNYEIGKEYDTPDWSPDKAQDEMQQAITALGKDNITGVYAANDGTAGGAIAAMKAAGIDTKAVPTTGQDAELAAIQRILAGEQYMTVYKAINPEAADAATIAVALLRGEDLPEDLITGTTDNGSTEVPSVIYDPVVVTKDNVGDTVVKDGYWSVDQICTTAFAQACADAGLTD